MDLFAFGTPVIDLFARVSGRELAGFGLKKGATNYFSAAKLAAIERKLGKKIIYRYPGDNARNVCEGFAALGGFCGYAGAVGSDRGAGEFEANLAQCNVAAFLQQKKGSTGKILALVAPDGQRTFCADLGATAKCSRFEKIGFESSRVLFVTSITFGVPCATARLAMRYLEAAKKAGKKIAIALESPPMVQKNRVKFLAIAKKYADVLFVNEDEAEALLGSGAGKKLLKLKPSALVYLKKGENGSLLLHRGKKARIPALPANAVDTTGAGDAYAAGVLYGLSRGYSALSSAKIGCMLATKVVGKMGAGIPHAHARMRIRHWKKS